MDLGVGWVTHSFMVIPECPYLVLGRNLLTKMRAQIHFGTKGTQLLDRKGNPIQFLTLNLPSYSEYWLFEQPSQEIKLSPWLQEFSKA